MITSDDLRVPLWEFIKREDHSVLSVVITDGEDVLKTCLHHSARSCEGKELSWLLAGFRLLHTAGYYAMFQNQYFIIRERNNKFVAEVSMRNFIDKCEMVRWYSEVERVRRKKERKEKIKWMNERNMLIFR
jgi:hypothetical protein